MEEMPVPLPRNKGQVMTEQDVQFPLATNSKD